MKARIGVRVQPRASQTQLGGKSGDLYKLRLTAPPVDGKANDACVRFFADRLRVPLASVRVVSGHTGRNKIIEIDGMDRESLERALES